ncbi:MAG: Holliday junction branch migration protein RuvA [Proteobacteria bacterium]|nr:Holliday junction branch migration protein RuvA [Pseudomonadota bacterium]NDG26081.1 Holliday junction branch migration protein RuvA [Pseudomonadota bacterium]
MLGFIQGKLISKNVESLHCVVLAQSVGYEVLVPKRSIEKLPVQSDVCLWLHTHVREDVLSLYGFESENEKLFFRVLLSVSGLGPKTALSLLSEHGADSLIELILGKRVGEIAKAPGVGKKTAERLVIELAGKIEKLSWAKDYSQLSETLNAKLPTGLLQIREDLSSALVHLGYLPHQIKGTIEKAMTASSDKEPTFESLLKFCLKELSNRSLSSGRLSSEVGNG